MSERSAQPSAASADDATTAMREVLDGHRTGLSVLLPFAGPAVVVSVAYIDPGNFATNIQAGARYGYALLWVVLLANVIAMIFQSLSARLGIVTGRNLAELCRDHFPRPIVYLMWGISEIAAMATDLAEFLGGAIGLSLLFHLPLMLGMAITALLTYVILVVGKQGFRRLEIIIGALVSVIGLSYLAELFIAPVMWKDVGKHLVSFEMPDAKALTIAVGIVGATVMPHALFLHSGLTQRRMPPRNETERHKLLKYSQIEVIVALSVAGLINVAMVVMASAAFHPGHADVARIETAYRTLMPALGIAAAGMFLVALIASGVSSSVVGTMAGQMIMQGFVDFQIPVWLRRLITMIPSLIVVALGVNATTALVASQVVLSLTLPFPMMALVWFTGRQKIMGAHRNSFALGSVAILAASVVWVLNCVLLLQIIGINIPRLHA